MIGHAGNIHVVHVNLREPVYHRPSRVVRGHPQYSKHLEGEIKRLAFRSGFDRSKFDVIEAKSRKGPTFGIKDQHESLRIEENEEMAMISNYHLAVGKEAGQTRI